MLKSNGMNVNEYIHESRHVFCVYFMFQFINFLLFFMLLNLFKLKGKKKGSLCKGYNMKVHEG